jgi:hypothetical protein
MNASVAIHVLNEAGGYDHDGVRYDAAELGAVPNVGDRIVHPGEPPPPRIVYEVVGRYFLGREAEDAAPLVALFVRADAVGG